MKPKKKIKSENLISKTVELNLKKYKKISDKLFKKIFKDKNSEKDKFEMGKKLLKIKILFGVRLMKLNMKI